ncbi:prolyl oligopeptidase family serine peptidase [Corynebacterium freneyi]|uniref:prolyl oligopeptidase family serine peptidase n=1 Tax=Corynebacterium freneyi TaxID=134034 RepID=UPI00254D4B69|nr:prolyl oligopeptidase family serine peptidase [Corynebacterium freneyi]MDK8768098.1 prolyl oligopeptidase family serine peptidase [Corynebacterium freneyi]
MVFSFADHNSDGGSGADYDGGPDAGSGAVPGAPAARFLPTDGVPEWLDDIEGERALEWARARTAETESLFDGDSSRDELERDILAALDTDARIPYPVRRGEHLYNFWRDGEHPRGLWRRTSLESFLSGEPEWEVLIDVDALASSESENWVWKGAQCRYPDYDRALVHLSRGGADASVIREFDLETLEFVAESPFELPEAKSDVSWAGRDEILVGTDMGPGSLTASGYPKQVFSWRRGTALDEAELIFSGHNDDVAVGGWFDATEGFERLFVERAIDFYRSRRFIRTDGGLQIIEVPDDCRVSVHREYLLLMPRTDFNGIPAGGLAVALVDEWLRGDRNCRTLFTPDAHTSLQSVAWTKTHLVLTLLHDVATRLVTLSIGDWAEGTIPGLPESASVSVVGTSPTRDDELWLAGSSTLEPATLWLTRSGADEPPRVARRAPSFFDATGMSTRLHWATSADGTKIPYRITGLLDDGHRESEGRGAADSVGSDFAGDAGDAAGGAAGGTTGPRPTLVHAYGGFEVSLVPGYSATRGMGWLARGGLSVEANLRGGGEFGPEWHSSAVKLNRGKVYEDHRAVLEDIVARGYATPDTLAIRGGSNGGLLSAVALTSYPERVGAVVSQVPLADMLRYHRLSAGASWMAEYGDPDDGAEGAAIREWSPVQRIARRDDRPYPPALVTTSTRDDRVHPAHARSLAWLLREAGQPVDYHENTEGGHAGAADNAQVAHMEALIHSWLWRTLG